MDTFQKSIAYFDLLPDELVLKIVSLAVEKTGRDEQHDFLLDVIAPVSLRFRRIAKEKTFWEGEVTISLDRKTKTSAQWSSQMDTIGADKCFSKPSTKDMMEAKMRDAIRNFIHAGVHSLIIAACAEPATTYRGRGLTRYMPLISSDDIISIASKCPALGVLRLSWLRMEPWPTFPIPSIEELHLSDMRIHMNMLSKDDVSLHRSLPNLRVFKMLACSEAYPRDDSRIKLPDMTKCKKLEIIDLWGSSVEKPMLKIKGNLPSLRPAATH